MEAYKINIVVAGRTYPITVKSSIEEQGVRRAVDKINKMILSLENTYSTRDKQDVLSMCLVQFASQLELKQVVKEENQEQLIKGIQRLTDKIAKEVD